MDVLDDGVDDDEGVEAWLAVIHGGSQELYTAEELNEIRTELKEKESRWLEMVMFNQRKRR